MTQKINFIEKTQVLIDASLNRGRKASLEYPKQKTDFYTNNGKEMAKIDASANYLEEKLFKATQQFPSFELLEPFYHDLYECIIDVDEMKKTLSSISSVARLIKKIRRDHLVKIKELKYSRGREKQALNVTKAYIGRMASLIKGISKHVEFYNECARKLNELPSIRTNEECVILAGYPNVGKSTLLAKITESKPEIANYPFTTKGLNVGVFMMRYLPIQVIDTPGLLDRPLSERNKIELKAITALQYLKGILAFVVDPMDDVVVQKKLFLETKKLFLKHKFLIVITKSDLANETQIANAKKEFGGYEIIVDGADKTALKDYFLAQGKKLFE